MREKVFLESMLAVPDISKKLWTIAYSLITLGTLIALIGAWGVVFWVDWLRLIAALDILVGGGLIWLGCFMIEEGMFKIPSDPPHVALLTIWGTRVKVVLHEGEVLLAKYWPLKVSATLIPVEAHNYDFTFKDVRCRNATDEKGDAALDPTVTAAGGAVTVEVSVTISPDVDAHDRHGHDCTAERLISFLDHGGLSGVVKILEDMIGESVRHLAGLYDWETFTFMKAPLSVALLAKISDIDFKKLPRGPGGEIGTDAINISPEDYSRLEEIEVEPLEYLFDTQDRAEQHRRLQEMEVFLKIARLNGVSDIIDLGTHIGRLNVKHIGAEGKLAEDAEGAAREKKQRESEKMDVRTGIELAGMYIDFANDGSLSKADALQLARIDRGRASERIIRTPDAKDSLTKAAAVASTGKD